jgi:putative FmdB family regulatory protein
MPIFEYVCKACGHQFEFLKLPATPAASNCPACQSANLERRLSGFALSTAALTKARQNAALKQQRQSKDFKDKEIARTEDIASHHH